MTQPPDKNVPDNWEDSDSDSESQLPCHSCAEMTYGLEMKTNNISQFGYNLRAAITNCEIMIIDYNKMQRELSPVAGPSNPVEPVDENAPSCSGSSANAGADAGAVAGADSSAGASANAGVNAGANPSANAGANASANAGVNASANGGANAGASNEIDIFSEHLEELADFVRQMNYRRSRNSEKQTFGSWLFISYVTGGWGYDTVRNYFLEKFGVTCMRSRPIPGALVTDKKFKAIVKFESSEQLNLVVMSLRQNQIHDNFLFLSFDKLPIDLASDYSDSDSDGSRSGFLIPVSNEFEFK